MRAPPGPLPIEGRSVWLTDAFWGPRGRNLLPGSAAKTAVFAPPATSQFSTNKLIFLGFMTWHGGCKDFTSRRLGRGWRARFRQGRPREGMTWLDEQGRMPMQNAGLVGLSRQVALAGQMDVDRDHIANLNTTGPKRDGSIFEEYLSTGSLADQPRSRVSFVRDRGVWHDRSQGPIERT